MHLPDPQTQTAASQTVGSQSLWGASTPRSGRGDPPPCRPHTTAPRPDAGARTSLAGGDALNRLQAYLRGKFAALPDLGRGR